MVLSFHVLANTAFGTNYPFASVNTPLKDDYSMTHAEAWNISRQNLIVSTAISDRILLWPIMPRAWAKVGRAMKDLRRYMSAILEKEQDFFAQGAPSTGSLLGALVRNSEDIKWVRNGNNSHMAPNTASERLTRSEVIGNIYGFSLAGHETTGNALAFAIYLLTAYPEVQAWVQEEIDQVYSSTDPDLDASYELCPRFKRCLAVLVSLALHQIPPRTPMLPSMLLLSIFSLSIISSKPYACFPAPLLCLNGPGPGHSP